MARSRSSFELTSAIATASTLAREEKKPGAPVTEPGDFRGVALVSFQPGEAPPLPPTPAVPMRAVAPPSSRRSTQPAPPGSQEPSRPLAIPPPPHGSSAPPAPLEEMADGRREPPPRLPDLSNVVSPIVRCEKVIEWITEATRGTGVFIADAEGLAVAGDIHDAEARIGATGLVASAIATLLQALPGQPSPLFEVHIGDGPYFQLIGFQAAKGTFMVGLTRPEPLSPRQAHAIRLACRHAFGEPISSAATGSAP